jgi:glycosyltransferase involved in cell wall biosynthesis
MRVVMTADAVGGIWQYALDLAESLAARDVETALVVLGPPPTPEQRRDADAIAGLELIVTDLPLDWLARSPSEVRGAARGIASLAHQSWADLVHLNTPSLAAGAHYDVPVLAVCHSCVASWWTAVKDGPLPADFVWRAEIVRAGLYAAHRAVAPSRAFAEAVRATYRLAATPAVVHNGRKPPMAVEEAAVAPGDPLVFAAGRLWDEGKNIAVVDRAAARLSTRVVVAGPIEGPDGTRATIAHAEAIGNLSAAGVRRWLAGRPTFVAMSLYEPFGLAVLEAAQAGCPLVLSDIATFRELWEGAAEFVSPHDERALAAAIERVTGDAALRRRLSRAAEERARRYTVAAMADKMLALYRELIFGPQPTRWMAVA